MSSIRDAELISFGASLSLCVSCCNYLYREISLIEASSPDSNDCLTPGESNCDLLSGSSIARVGLLGSFTFCPRSFKY